MARSDGGPPTHGSGRARSGRRNGGRTMSGIEAAFFGALSRDAEAKTSKAGKAYLRLNIRVGDGDGAQWVSTMVFDQNAIDAADKLLKGARVYVEGSLSVTEWDGQDGAKRHGL